MSRIDEAIKEYNASSSVAYEDVPDHLARIVQKFYLTAEELLEALSDSRSEPLDEDAAICRRVHDVAFRLNNGELTPEVVCLAAIAARDYCACFGKYPDALMPPAHYEMFDDWIADLAAGATDREDLDGHARFRNDD